MAFSFCSGETSEQRREIDLSSSREPIITASGCFKVFTGIQSQPLTLIISRSLGVADSVSRQWCKNKTMSNS